MDFKVGDKVKLATGGPVMKITKALPGSRFELEHKDEAGQKHGATLAGHYLVAVTKDVG